MILRPKHLLGLALEENAILVAEVRSVNRRLELRAVAELPVAVDEALRDPAALGKALRQRLGQARVRARRAVVGVPARWLVSREVLVPPADPEALAAILRIEAEKAFAHDAGETAVDYAEGCAREGGRTALLLAAPRGKLDQLSAMARAARLRLTAVTPTALLLGSAGQAASGPTLTIYLRAGGADLALSTNGGFRSLRHLSVTSQEEPAAAEDIATQVRTAIALLPGGLPGGQEVALRLWDSAGMDLRLGAVLAERLGLVSGAAQGLADVAVEDRSAAHGLPPGRCAVAAALAAAGLRGLKLPADFLHSRLAVAHKGALGRRAVRAGLAAGAVLAIGAGLLLDWRARLAEAQELRARLAAMEPDIEAAEKVVQRVSAARPWYEGRPQLLQCLRELTLTFPLEGRIWATSLALQDTMAGVLSGKASDQRSVLEVLDRIQAAGAFSEVKLLHIRQTSPSSQEVSFAISFSYTGGKAQP